VVRTYGPRMTGNTVVRPGRRALAQLGVVVDAAREEVAVSRRLDPANRDRLVRAQRHLLAALDIHVRALEAAGLQPHPQLRGEIALLRAVTGAAHQRSS
jgi:hypothetical protein